MLLSKNFQNQEAVVAKKNKPNIHLIHNPRTTKTECCVGNVDDLLQTCGLKEHLESIIKFLSDWEVKLSKNEGLFNELLIFIENQKKYYVDSRGFYILSYHLFTKYKIEEFWNHRADIFRYHFHLKLVGDEKAIETLSKEEKLSHQDVDNFDSLFIPTFPSQMIAQNPLTKHKGFYSVTFFSKCYAIYLDYNWFEEMFKLNTSYLSTCKSYLQSLTPSCRFINSYEDISAAGFIYAAHFVRDDRPHLIDNITSYVKELFSIDIPTLNKNHISAENLDPKFFFQAPNYFLRRDINYTENECNNVGIRENDEKRKGVIDEENENDNVYEDK
jgi:hypothetical protein